MDKNYNVDDILSEIKRRKSDRKAGGAGAAPDPERPDPADRTAGPAQDRIPPGRAAPAPRDAQRGRMAEAPQPDHMDEFATSLFEPPLRASGSQKVEPDPEPEPPRDRDDGFQFVMPPVEKIQRNPMNFDGHVQSIEDRARRRPNRFAKPSAEDSPPAVEVPVSPAPPIRFVPPREEPPKDAPIRFVAPGEDQQPPDRPMDNTIDFSAFRPPVDDGEEAEAVRKRATGPFSRFSKSREFRPEDLLHVDFGAEPDCDDEDDPDFADSFVLEPATSSIDFSEYNSVRDRGAVAKDIAHVKLMLVVRTLLTLILTSGLFYLALSVKYPLPLPPAIWPESNMRAYLITIAVAGVLTAVVNSSSVGGGLMSLFKMRANSDTLAAVALLAGIGQAIGGAVNHATVEPDSLSLYVCVGGLAMLFNALGKMTMINRIQANFRIIASDDPKRAVLAAESEVFCRGFAGISGRRRPVIAHSAKADFFTDFLALSYSDKYDVGINRGVAPICLLGAVLVAVLSYLLTGNGDAAITAFVSILCVAATLSATFIENIPLGKLTRKLAPRGGMVSGNKAVEDFCDTQAVVLRENDLFPEGMIQLHGIKTFEDGRIDEAILDAASVVCACEGALSPVFLNMIGNNRKLLRRVENLVFEDGMGISAWVDARRILLGNRQLMHNHGVAVPEEGYEQKYEAEHGEAIYLSTAGELTAQFVVSYQYSEQLAVELDNMASLEKPLIVYTTDSNLTPQKIQEVYSYPQELVRVVPAALHGEWKTMSAPRDTAMAEIVYSGDASVMVACIRACLNARASILIATIIQLVQIVLGYGFLTFLAFMGASGTVDILSLSVYQIFWFAVVFIVQQVRQG